MKTHNVKLDAVYFDSVRKRIKNAEIRFNDRDYKTLDWLVLEEWTGKEYTGRIIVRRISGVFPLDRFGLDGWVVLCLD